MGESDGIDILVVAAGMNFPERRLEQLTAEGWDAMISVNLSGAFYAIRAALPYLRASQGLVVLISSVSGRWPDASGPAYQASKAGMVELAHAAGFEEHVERRRFTSILPGIVDTPILDNRPEPPPKEVRDAALKSEDVAQACLFLATLPPRAYVPELTMVPTAIQALGKTSTATPPSHREMSRTKDPTRRSCYDFRITAGLRAGSARATGSTTRIAGTRARCI